MTRDQLSDRERGIAALRAAGFGLRRIGHAFGLSHTQVRRILDRLAQINESNTFRRQNFPTLGNKTPKPHFRGRGRSAFRATL